MKRSFLVMLLMFVVMPICVVNGEEIGSQVRYGEVESVTVEEVVDWTDPYGIEMINSSHFIYTFALFKVNEWGDRCHYKVWVDGELVADWRVGFSANDPPGLQGIYINYDVGLVQILTLMAEFPFRQEKILHPTDGLQTYYFYRMHFYFNATIFKGDEVRLAADYMKEPTFEGSELTILKMKNGKTRDGVTTFKYKTIKQK